MSRLLIHLCSCLVALTLSACALPPHSGPQKKHSSKPEPVIATAKPPVMLLLNYYQDISLQSESSLEREWKFYQAALVDGHCDTARMRLGLVMLRAVELELALKPDPDILYACIHDADLSSGIPSLAQLIQAQLQHRSEKQTHQHEASRAIENLKKENQELRRQVDGLKAIERSLQDRRHLE